MLDVWDHSVPASGRGGGEIGRRYVKLRTRDPHPWGYLAQETPDIGVDTGLGCGKIVLSWEIQADGY